MSSSMDRSRREKQLKKAQEKRAKENAKENAKEKRNASSKAARKDTSPHGPRSTASKETSRAVRFMFMSSVILLVVFVIFEVLLLIFSGGLGDLDTHLANMADNTLAFVIGLGAMDAVTYFNTVGRSRRNEMRAIIRHNRLLEPSIDMFTARKNVLITRPGEIVDQYSMKSNIPIEALADMFGPSGIASDAGMSKIDMYSFHQNKLYESFRRMVEDIDFSFYPEAAEAAMKFINATTYGSSSLASLISYQDESQKAKRALLVKSIAAEANDPSPEHARPELMSVYILMQTIHAQEDALRQYLDAVSDIVDPDIH